MKEYTFFASLVLTGAFIFDWSLGVRVSGKKPFWLLMLVIVFCEAVVNGYLTSRPVFFYGKDFISNVWLGTIPLEDFIYGFSFVVWTIVLWECFLQRAALKRD